MLENTRSTKLLIIDEICVALALGKRDLINHNRANAITMSNASCLFDIKYFSPAYPIQRFLQQAHCKMADGLFSFSFPAQRTLINMPENFIIFFFNTYFLIGVLVKKIRKRLGTCMQFCRKRKQAEGHLGQPKH